MKLSLSALAFAALTLTGCSVMHFKNGPVEATGRTSERWHHSVGYALYELSGPLDMTKLCADKSWSMVTTQESVATGVAGMVGGAIWNPQLVLYTCGK